MGNNFSEHPLADAIINKIDDWGYGPPLSDEQINQLKNMDIELRNNYKNIPEKIEKLLKTYIDKEVEIITPKIIFFQNRDFDDNMDKPWQYIIQFKYLQFHRGLFNIKPILTLWMNETKLRLEIGFHHKPYILLYASDGVRAGMLHIESNDNLQERCLPIKF